MVLQRGVLRIKQNNLCKGLATLPSIQQALNVCYFLFSHLYEPSRIKPEENAVKRPPTRSQCKHSSTGNHHLSPKNLGNFSSRIYHDTFGTESQSVAQVHVTRLTASLGGRRGASPLSGPAVPLKRKEHPLPTPACSAPPPPASAYRRARSRAQRPPKSGTPPGSPCLTPPINKASAAAGPGRHPGQRSH